MKPIVYVKEGSTLPIQGTPSSAGYDLVAHKDWYIKGGSTGILIPTNLYIALPTWIEAQVRPRSGLSLKTTLRLSNSPGTIDADYRGEIGVIVDNIGTDPIRINKGDRIAQLVFVPVIHPNFVVVDELPETERGSGGFGSTGVNIYDNIR